MHVVGWMFLFRLGFRSEASMKLASFRRFGLINFRDKLMLCSMQPYLSINECQLVSCVVLYGISFGCSDWFFVGSINSLYSLLMIDFTR